MARSASPSRARLRRPVPIRSLRAYLVMLVVAIVLPLVVFALMQEVRNAQHRRHSIDAGLLSTARAVAVVLEQELQGSISALTALAATREMEANDLEAFYDEARHIRDVQPWYSVWLLDLNGRHLLNLLQPYGSRLPALDDREYIKQALTARRATVSGLVHDGVTSKAHIAITVPVVQQGVVRYLLVAGMHPRAISSLIAATDSGSSESLVSVLDQNFLVLARSRDGEQWVGRPAMPYYVQVVSRAPEGIAKTVTLDGETNYTAFRRLNIAGWIVGVGTPASAVDKPLARDIAFTVAVGIAMLLMAIGAARLLGRRLTRPIAQLAASARDIAEDRVPTVAVDTSLKELQDLKLALVKAGEAIGERHRIAQREREFAFELAAAEDRERQQIARDLHDNLSQTLAALQIRLAPLCRYPDADVAKAANELAALAKRADRSTRSLSEQIAPSILYDLGLLPALEWLADEMEQQFRLIVQVSDDGNPQPLRPEVRAIVYRAVRELVINVAKHADCDLVDVTLQRESDVLRVTVRDQGMGFDVTSVDTKRAGHGMGLRSVRERLSRVGGTFEIRSEPDSGTEAVLRVPLVLTAEPDAVP